MSEPKPLLTPLKPPSTDPKLWRGGRFEPDTWRSLDDAEMLPIEGRAILTLSRWRAEQATLAALSVPLGIKVQSNEALDPETDDLDRLQLIALAFPKFTDGRAYSTARRLKEWGYKGEIRATGDVLLDQIPLMLRCGFDSLEIVHAPTIEALERGELPAVTRTYQTAAESASPLWHSRRAAVARGAA